MWGEARKAIKVMGTGSARADVTLTSLLRDMKGMACLVWSTGLAKQRGNWRSSGGGGGDSKES